MLPLVSDNTGQYVWNGFGQFRFYGNRPTRQGGPKLL
jgi:hypothetical protein